MKKQSHALVAGESAEVLLEIMRGFALRVDAQGSPQADIQLDGQRAPIFWRAYEQVEMELIIDRENCAAQHEHAVLSADEWQWLVLDILAEEICTALGHEFPDGAPWALLLTDYFGWSR